MRGAAAFEHAESQLAPGAELAPEVDALIDAVDAIVADLPAVLDLRHVVRLDLRVRRHEVARGVRQRLIQLGAQQRIRAELPVQPQFGAERIELGDIQATGRIEDRVALEVVLQ